jgi:hypothetical protein
VHHYDGNYLDLNIGSSPHVSKIDSVSKCVEVPPLASDHLVVGTGAFLGGHYSKGSLINFGGISKQNSNIRSSDKIRAQFNADDTQVDRAMNLTEVNNIGSFQGTNAHSKFFLHSI